jgi:hypothetical protein
MWSQNCDDCSPERLVLQVATIMLAPALEPDPQILQPTPAAVTGTGTPPVEDNSNAIDVASSPVAEESAPAPTIPVSTVATKAKPAPEPEYIDPPEFDEEDEFERDEVAEDQIPF